MEEPKNLSREEIQKEIYIHNRTVVFEWIESIIDDYIARHPERVEQCIKNSLKDYASIEDLKKESRKINEIRL